MLVSLFISSLLSPSPYGPEASRVAAAPAPRLAPRPRPKPSSLAPYYLHAHKLNETRTVTLPGWKHHPVHNAYRIYCALSGGYVMCTQDVLSGSQWSILLNQLRLAAVGKKKWCRCDESFCLLLHPLPLSLRPPPPLFPQNVMFFTVRCVLQKIGDFLCHLFMRNSESA